MRSITTLDLQYAHRFYGFKGEAQYLHGHTGVLTIEVEDTVEPGVNMVFPCNEIKKNRLVSSEKFRSCPDSERGRPSSAGYSRCLRKTGNQKRSPAE